MLYEMDQLQYTYDQGNKLLKVKDFSNNYNESLQYDKNGNITHLYRSGGFDFPDAVESIDNLTYECDEGNRLLAVSDATNSPEGFNDGNTTGDDYEYDENGNMTRDNNKGIAQINYNFLNLPTEILWENGNRIRYLYNAAGGKVAKTVIENGNSDLTEYLSGYQYLNQRLQFFPTSEGYVNHENASELQEMNDSKFSYVYNYTDHLGNVRLSYTQNPKNSQQLIIIEENNYYPFGLRHGSYNKDIKEIKLEDFIGISGAEVAGEGQNGLTIVPALENSYQYKYNGKELQAELGLEWYDYHARNYDPAIGRWMNPDPLSETSVKYSPYTYAVNNPVYFIDPDGMQAASPTDIIEFNVNKGTYKIIENDEIDRVYIVDDEGNRKLNGDGSEFYFEMERDGQVADGLKESIKFNTGYKNGNNVITAEVNFIFFNNQEKAEDFYNMVNENMDIYNISENELFKYSENGVKKAYFNTTRLSETPMNENNLGFVIPTYGYKKKYEEIANRNSVDKNRSSHRHYHPLSDLKPSIADRNTSAKSTIPNWHIDINIYGGDYPNFKVIGNQSFQFRSNSQRIEFNNNKIITR